MSKEVTIPQEVILSKIYEIRGQKVMLDSDLAELYGVETKALKRAVRRNIDIFPEHFMFELTKEEHESLRYQIGTSNEGRGGTRYLPMVFTEHGIIHAAHVLRSPRARKMSVRITEIFIRMREILQTHQDLFLQLEEIRSKVSGQEEQIALIFEYIKQFEQIKQQELEQQNRPPIGYKTGKK
ncbi:ORF6N domain-containing protein [Candidatus Poribacteria bacterium]|nr:ORF6N domain-containing protein [Candidatus Poribacteria bacterium]